MVFDHDFNKFPELTNSQMVTEEFNSPHKQIKEDFIATVIRVVDGDTVRLTTNFRDFDFPLRLLDINAPELNEGGQNTKTWLKNKIEGQEVMIQIDPSNRVGRYGRLLGRILYNGLDVGLEMLSLFLVTRFGQQPLIPNLDKELRLSKWF